MSDPTARSHGGIGARRSVAGRMKARSSFDRTAPVGPASGSELLDGVTAG
jgi:hypothetical protein